jgi:hypothetical protein
MLTYSQRMLCGINGWRVLTSFMWRVLTSFMWYKWLARSHVFLSEVAGKPVTPGAGQAKCLVMLIYSQPCHARVREVAGKPVTPGAGSPPLARATRASGKLRPPTPTPRKNSCKKRAATRTRENQVAPTAKFPFPPAQLDPTLPRSVTLS